MDPETLLTEEGVTALLGSASRSASPRRRTTWTYRQQEEANREVMKLDQMHMLGCDKDRQKDARAAFGF